MLFNRAIEEDKLNDIESIGTEAADNMFMEGTVARLVCTW